MKVYLVHYCYYEDYKFVGVFTSEEIAEKYIIEDMQFCFGEDYDNEVFESIRPQYCIYVEDVITE